MWGELCSLSCLSELVAALQLKLVVGISLLQVLFQLKLVAGIALLQVPFQLKSIVDLSFIQVANHCFPGRLSNSFRILNQLICFQNVDKLHRAGTYDRYGM